jgi:hypothetical protein
MSHPRQQKSEGPPEMLRPHIPPPVRIARDRITGSEPRKKKKKRNGSWTPAGLLRVGKNGFFYYRFISPNFCKGTLLLW